MIQEATVLTLIANRRNYTLRKMQKIKHIPVNYASLTNYTHPAGFIVPAAPVMPLSAIGYYRTIKYYNSTSLFD